MKIAGKQINPGSKKVISIPVGRLPSGNSISLSAHVFRGKKNGPTCLLLGGVHGDEINGVEIIRRVINTGLAKKLENGTIIAIPLLNVFGFINFSRDLPDGKDVNRSFPGNPEGSLASRVAFTLTKKIIPLVDFCLDFHTGGKSIFNYPQVRFTGNHDGSTQLAKDFGAPVSLESKLIQKSLRKYFVEHNKPLLVFEGGESLRLDGYSIQKGLEGVERVLSKKNMITGKVNEGSILKFKKSSWLRAPRSGIFVWTKSSGILVQKNEPLGYIGDPYGNEQERILANKSGFLIGHNNAPVVNQGDALFHIAYS